MNVILFDVLNKNINYYKELRDQFSINFPTKIINSKSTTLNFKTDLESPIFVLGFGITDIGGKKKLLPNINGNTNRNGPLFVFLNKEYDALYDKLDWIYSIKPTTVFTVCHKNLEFQNYIKNKFDVDIPFVRFSWSCDFNKYKKINDSYNYDVFFSGVIRKEQTNDWRNKILSIKDKLNVNWFFNYGLYHNNKMIKKFDKLKESDYINYMQSSKISLVTTGPADLVGTRFFEISATNKSLLICNRMSSIVYNNMFIENFNCVMFDSLDEFIEKINYYLINDSERLKIVNNAFDYYNSHLKWSHFFKQFKELTF